MSNYRYQAFLSYSHADRRMADWLHRRLESYRFSRAVRQDWPELPRRLFPIFRDREELSTSQNLGTEIEAALASSERLIVLCSENAASSHWIDQEIRAFQRTNRADRIFCVILDGDPSAPPGRGGCFPPALSAAETGQEPLAADLRDHADGKRLGLLKLIAGMFGLPLDGLVQRDLARARRRVTAVTAGASAIVLALGGLTTVAVQAQSEAEQRRHDAEGQIEFMLTDLRGGLETVGRIDVLQPVGERAAAYYDGYPLSDHDEDALGRRARVFHFLGELQDTLGNRDEASRFFQQAHAATRDLLRRDPEASQRLFEHSQSAYWVGYAAWRAGDLGATQAAFEDYLDIVRRWEPGAEDRRLATIELSNAHATLGTFHFNAGDFAAAAVAFSASKDVLENGGLDLDEDAEAARYLSDSLGWLAAIRTKQGDLESAKAFRTAEITQLENLVARDPETAWPAKTALANAVRNRSRLHFLTGDYASSAGEAEKARNMFQALTQHDDQNQNWWELRARTEAMHLASVCMGAGHRVPAAVLAGLNETLGQLPEGQRPSPSDLIARLELETPIDLEKCNE